MMDFKKLDGFVESLPEASIPGGELLVTKNGEEVYHKVFGLKDTALNIPASEDDIYWLYSASKVITCVCALQLLEAGKTVTLTFKNDVSPTLLEGSGSLTREDGVYHLTVSAGNFAFIKF